IGVDVNLSANVETVGIVPDMQTEYGPGYDRATNMGSFGSTDDGWINLTVNGQPAIRPIFRAYGQFGPKLDGREVYWWDGEFRSYSASGNPYKDFYRNGYSSVANIALGNSSDKGNYRISFTRNDYKGIQVGGKQEKNTFNLNSSYKVTSRVTADIVLSYINEKVHNRPYLQSRIAENYGGFFSPMDRMDVYFNKYKTTKGYKWVPYNNTALDPAEAIKYNIRAYDFLDFLWNQLENSYDETTNRLIGAATLNYSITKNLNLRGKIGTDYTGYFQESKERSTQPLAFGPSGYYGTRNNRYTFNYGDLLLSYGVNVLSNLKLNISAGYQARKEEYRYSGQGTSGGLTQENWFTMNASKDPVTGGSSRVHQTKDGLFGILGFEFNDYLFVEGTLRRERTSTLFPGKNIFYYPAVSAAFELSRAMKLPAFVDYSKLRASYGETGNPPDPYFANVVYNAGSINGVPVLYPRTSYGNNDLKNERKKEIEIGWETRLLKDRLGFDVSYYSGKVIDQILSLTVPASSGATGIATNVGSIKNYGVELSLYGTPVKLGNFKWDSRINVAFNRNELVSLNSGATRLNNSNYDNGSLLIVSDVGQPAYDIIGYKRRTDANGEYVINSDGYYDINFEDPVKMGNLQAKATGGMLNTFTYKNLSLNVVIDFRYGGQVISPGLLYGTGAGLYTNSLFGRDAEHGGLAYYVNGAGKNVLATAGAATGPNGEKIYHDGMILKGVKSSDGKTNDIVIDAPSFYLNTYSWGSWPGSGSYSTYEGAVFDNDYIKFREVALSYKFPGKIASKLKAQDLVLTLYGRNLFYLHKTLPYLDPEEGAGTKIESFSVVGGGTAQSRSFGASLRVSF
ncbi:MAG TPA: SusC/RagA family TonB-linked outer membrane protein, partial [Chitinophagaceae bacterium]